jgi:hypothetical protein
MALDRSNTAQSFFDEHKTLAEMLLTSKPLPNDADVTAYLKPQVDFKRLFAKIPDRELFRFDHQWTRFVEAFGPHAADERPWPKTPYCFRHGRNNDYEQWLSGLSDDARGVENAAVRSRHHAEHTICVKALLHFQILWPNPSDPNYVTPANWDAEGVGIADRYAHRQPDKAHWLLDIADTYRVYNSADSRNVTPPTNPGKPTPA